MLTYFIADLHLSETEPHLYALFERFLSHYLKAGDRLYILGDLFSLWIGDDHQAELHQAVISQLAQLAERQIEVFLLLGNRDFLIGQRFASAAHLTLLPEKYLLKDIGGPVLLLHGDTLCTLDYRYQAFRRKTQQPWLQWLFLHLPLAWRLKVAERLRQNSNSSTTQLSKAMMDVVDQSVLAECDAAGVSCLIHGHTHLPGIHLYRANQSPVVRYTLSDWGRLGNYLVIDEVGHKQLCYFDLAGQDIP